MDLERVRTDMPVSGNSRLYVRAILVLIGGNILLTISKGLLAAQTGSSAIFSDAANSLSDIFYSILLGIGLFVAAKPADESHPQGHIRFEPLVSLFITVVMAGAGITAIYQSLKRFISGALPIELALPTVVLLGAVGVKAVMFKMLGRVGQEARSPAIIASAKDNMADVLTSLAAIVGIWGALYIHPILDPAGGIVVALWIFRTIWVVAGENVGYLTGRGASQEMIEEITEKTYEVAGVENVHRVIADYVGPQLRVEMHINVEGSMTIEHAHKITEEVRQKLGTLFDVDLVFIHVEPAQRGK